VLLAFEQAVGKAFSCPLIATALHQNINHIAILIDGLPQILAPSLNGDKPFINVPGVT
jgi:hypothetical protein